MTAALVPLNNLGIGIIVATVLVTLSVIVTAYRVTRKQVGRFLHLLRITLTLNVLWQVFSVLYFMVPDDFVPMPISAGLEVLSSNLFAMFSVLLNVSILEAFQVLTHLSIRTTNIYRLIITVLFLLDVLVFCLGYYGGMKLAESFMRPMFLIFGGYTILFNNLKTIYLLRLVYLDRINSQRIQDYNGIFKTQRKYYKLNVLFLVIFALNLTFMVIWGYGHITENQVMIKISETLLGIDLNFYPKLICGIRDLKFDRQEAKTVHQLVTESSQKK